MSTRASLLGHGDDPVLRAGDGAAHEQQIALGVDPHHPQPELGVALGALVAGHPLPFDDARRVGARADRAGLAVAGVAVRGRAAAKAMAMNHALEAAPLGGAGDLYQLAGGEDVHLHLRAERRGLTAVHGEHAEHARRGIEPCLLGVTDLGPGGRLLPPGAESQLNSTLPHLHHMARPSLDHGDRHGGAVLREDAGHAQLPADQSCAHRYSTLISTSTPAGRSSLVSASMVWGRESLMSSRRLWVRSSNCSRLFLSMCGLRNTVHRSVLTGSGIGPDTCAPVFSAVRTMSAAA